MPGMDIFTGSAFRTRELSDAINVVPNQFGRLGELGLFADKPIRTAQFQIEQKNGVLSIVQSSPRGTDIPGAERAKREMRNFATRRFALSGRITAEDVQGIRAFGSETELMQVQDLVNEVLVEHRQNLDITREFLRAGALRGTVIDADGTTIVNLFTEFGVTQKVVDFALGSGDPDKKAREVVRHIELNLKGDMMTGVHALCSPEFWDKLMANDDFKEAWKYYTSTVEPLRGDVRRGIPWQGITWEEYLGSGEVPQEDGSVVTQNFIPAGDARFFPLGTMNTFRTYNSPADYMETANTPGQPFYAKAMPDPKANRYVEVEAQMNALPICMRPAILVRGHSSN
ncbi:MAG: major capsid protein [Pikeienuella sp.]|uniref:major capsid protein n=1 Tax=Pikeienuella sp. TaxID=2831957 RepID=UPI00391D3C6F